MSPFDQILSLSLASVRLADQLVSRRGHARAIHSLLEMRNHLHLNTCARVAVVDLDQVLLWRETQVREDGAVTPDITGELPGAGENRRLEEDE